MLFGVRVGNYLLTLSHIVGLTRFFLRLISSGKNHYTNQDNCDLKSKVNTRPKKICYDEGRNTYIELYDLL